MKRIEFLVVIIVLFITSCNYSNSKKSDKDIKDITSFEETAEPKLSEDDNNEVINVDDNRCNIDIVLEVDERLEMLTEKQIYLFLYSFDESCLNNAEFSEYSNEVLFKILNKYPVLVASNLIKKRINKVVILEELSSPISELSNIENTYNAVLESNIEEGIKRELLNALKKE